MSEDIGKKVRMEGQALFECLVLLPEEFDASKSYNLVIGLHGGGSNAKRFSTLWKEFKKQKFIYVVPQAPYPWPGEEEVTYDWALWPTGDISLIDRAMDLTEQYLEDIVQFFGDQYKVNGVYLLGFSQGAIITYTVGIKRHHLFKGLICFGGPGLLAPLNSPFTGEFNENWVTKEDIQGATHLRVFIVHGENDKAAEYRLGIQSRDVLTDLGYDITFHSFEGGHIVPPKEILSQVLSWLDE
jgi:phospholipase/carboxylesterase